MSEQDYNIDELLEELHRKRSEIETRISDRAKGIETEEVDIADAVIAEIKGIKRNEPVEQTAEPEAEPEDESKDSAEDIAATISFELDEVRDLRKQLTKSIELADIRNAQEKKDEEAEVPGMPEEPADPSVALREEMDAHPIFTQPIADTNIIPKMRPRKNAEEEQRINVELRPEGEETGILNLKDEDDDFKAFFGDTVIVNHGDQERKRKNRISAFESGEEEIDAGTDPLKKQEILSARKKRSAFSAVCTGVLAAAALLCSTLFFSSFEFYDSIVYTAVMAGLLMLTAIVQLRGLVSGLRKLMSGKPNGFSMPAVAVLMCAAQCIMHCIDAFDLYPTSVACAILSVFGASLAYSMDVSRMYANVKKVNDIPRKYASLMLEDTSLSKALCRDLAVPEEDVFIKRRAGKVEPADETAAFDDPHLSRTFLPQIVCCALSVLLIPVSALVLDCTWMQAVDNASMAACIMAPLGVGLAAVLPLWKAQKKLDQVSCVLHSYACADEVHAADCVVLEGRELFPREKVLLHGIKTFERERVDKAILYAASVLIHSCDTMSHMFMKVIQGKTDILYDADSVVYEEGRGFSFWVDQNRVLVGRRELLEDHEISVPSRDYENRYTKTSTRDAIYLAVSGKLYAMFVISYQPDEDMQSMLQELVRQKKSIIVRTRDFILSTDKISRMYDIPRSMITLVRDGNMQDLAKETEHTSVSKSVLTHVGSSVSFINGLLTSDNVLSALRTSSAVCLVSLVVSALLAAALAFTGSLASTSVISVVLFHVIWLLVQTLSVILKKI